MIKKKGTMLSLENQNWKKVKLEIEKVNKSLKTYKWKKKSPNQTI